MTQGESQEANTKDKMGGHMGEWIFRILVFAGAAYMVYTWFEPWWAANIKVLPGEDHMVMRPWGIEVVSQVKNNADPSLWAMPWFFKPFMWTYLTICMLALALSLFINRQISFAHIKLPRVKLPLATLLIGFVGLSYLIAVVLAFVIGDLRAEMADSKFIGKSKVVHKMTGNKVKMVSDLKEGYWLALYSGPALIVLALLRGLFIRKPK
jgi:hypothetical protein